jgi:serine/threonine-protein kinase 19
MLQAMACCGGALGHVPLVVTHLIYGVVKNRTVVDREIDQLVHDGTLRRVYLCSRNEDAALVLSSDYAAEISRLSTSADGDGRRSACVGLLPVISRMRGASIPEAALVELLSTPGSSAAHQQAQKAVTHLVACGLLTPKRSQADVNQAYSQAAYWFSIPQMGIFIKSVVNGRKELVNFIKRSKYKEILQSKLEQKKLRSSKLGMNFHIRDIVAIGAVNAQQTTTDVLLRLAKSA